MVCKYYDWCMEKVFNVLSMSVFTIELEIGSLMSLSEMPFQNFHGGGCEWGFLSGLLAQMGVGLEVYTDRNF